MPVTAWPPVVTEEGWTYEGPATVCRPSRPTRSQRHPPGVAGFHTDGQGDVGSTSLRDAVQARLPETHRTHETVQAVEVERVGMRKHLYLRDSRCICKAPNRQSASGEPRVCQMRRWTSLPSSVRRFSSLIASACTAAQESERMRWACIQQASLMAERCCLSAVLATCAVSRTMRSPIESART
jgi:hypothetical protein